MLAATVDSSHYAIIDIVVTFSIVLHSIMCPEAHTQSKLQEGLCQFTEEPQQTCTRQHRSTPSRLSHAGKTI